MKRSIYIFIDDNRAALYGVGTYVKQLLSIKNIDILFNIIWLFCECEEFSIEKKGNLTIYKIPKPIIIKAKAIEYYKQSFKIIKSYIDIDVQNREKVFFHFNSYHHLNIIKLLKSYYKRSTIVFTIHYFEWLYLINGEIDKIDYYLENINLLRNKNFEIAFNIEKEVFNIADKIICLSPSTYSLLLSKHKISNKKMYLIPNGSKPVKRASKITKEMTRKYFNIKNNELVILNVGRVDRTKGTDVLIKSFVNLSKEKNNLHLIIVGDGDSDIINETSINNIHFTGRIEKSNLDKIYAIADIGVIPSICEQCSFVAIEMMSASIPIITFNSFGLKDMITNMDNGLIIERGNKIIEQLSQKIWFLLQNKRIRSVLSKRAYDNYVKKYNIKNMTFKMKTFIYI